MKYAYLVPEGHHDIAAVGQVLKFYNAKELTTIEQLNEQGVYEFWRKFIALDFPQQQDRRPKRRGSQDEQGARDFTMRMPVPTIYQVGDWSVALHSAGGDIEKIVPFLAKNLLNWDQAEELSAIGIFCDADDLEPAAVFEKGIQLISGVQDVSTVLKNFSELQSPGQVSNKSVKVGLYVFPDNEGSGTLENVLIQCAGETYPDFLTASRDYVGTVRPEWPEPKKLKATIGCITNALRPGASNAVSIQYDKWICEETKAIPTVAKLNQFIAELLDL